MVTDSHQFVCPVCGSGVEDVNFRPNQSATYLFRCGNVSILSPEGIGEYWSGECIHVYALALKYHEALKFYATAIASDISYDGGAKARVALLPVV